jgi:Protein of unknown function (DUF2442)
MNTTPINIVSVAQAGDYSLTIEFDDKTLQTVDFGAFLKRSRHPGVRAYLQPEQFASFHISYGELVWGDYDLCFPIIDLYRNCIDHVETIAHAA